jgi:tetratricopeptide (TPR) repeat protein
MSRVTRYKIGYVVALVALGLLSIPVIRGLGGGAGAMLAVAAVLLVPGRVQGVFFRDLFQGRRLLDTGHAAEAVPHLERFLQTVHAEPWRKRLLWLSWSIYTPNVEAMALNNLGAARMRLGQLLEAETAFQEALALDPLYPVPQFNIAILHEMRGDRATAERAVAEATRLGYTGGTVDTMAHAAQSLLAQIEGRSASTT